eukprot:1184103-Prorocentrum_minimum.AAC.3
MEMSRKPRGFVSFSVVSMFSPRFLRFLSLCMFWACRVTILGSPVLGLFAAVNWGNEYSQA